MRARLRAPIALALALAAIPASAVAQPLAGPDRPAETAIARAGTPAAASGALGRDRLERKLGRLINKAGPASGAYVYDTEARNRSTLFAEDGRTDRILASNMKLFTTATALERIGSNDRLETGVWAAGTLDGRVLRGDVYLVGDGDPALASKDFARRNGLPLTPLNRLSREIRDAGIRRITGKVLADDSIFDRRRGVPDSNWKTSEYIGPLSGLSYNAGFSGGGGFADEPALEAADELRDDLEKRGIAVGGKVRLDHAPATVLGADPLAVVDSPTIAGLVEETNRVSNNFYAEMLLKRIGAVGGKRGTTKRGAKKVEAFARELGTRVHAVDGSGLTRSNRASPLQVGKLLIGMLEHPAARAFRDSLALAGREGTLGSRMIGTAAEGSCEAKTGSLSDVSALSGYCQANGQTIAFSILMNNADVTQARSLQDKMAAAIARYRP